MTDPKNKRNPKNQAKNAVLKRFSLQGVRLWAWDISPVCLLVIIRRIYYI